MILILPMYYSITLIHIVKLCGATLTIRHNRIKYDFTMKLETENVHDPIGSFGLRSRQILCDIVITAKQFVHVFGPERREPTDNPHWEFLAFYRLMNYQRHSHTESVPTQPTVRFYKPRMVAFSNNILRKINVVQCVGTVEARWYIAFARQDKFMFLVELNSSHNTSALRPTAIIEPSALFMFPHQTEHEVTTYLLPHVKELKEVLQSICNLKRSDRMRICSSAFDALIKNGYFRDNVRQVNYVKVYPKCQTRLLRLNDLFVKVMSFLPCLVNDESSPLPQFFILKDPREDSSVFIFFPQRNTNVVIYETQIRKVGALVNTSRKSN